MQRGPSQVPPRGLAAFHALAAPTDPAKAVPAAQLHVLKAKAERARGTLEGLMQMVLVDDGNPNVKYMPEWQSILKGYQNVLLQLQDISSYIASTTVRSGLQPGAPSINPFAHALVHLQAPIPADNDSIGRLEYMAVPARLPAALEAERALFEENWPAAADWPTDEQIAGMMPNELGEVHDAVGRELAETRRRMARARAILGQLGEGFDWRMREADDKEEGEEEEGGGEEGERLADGAAATPAESGAADTPASRDDLFGDESNESTPAAPPPPTPPTSGPPTDGVIELSDDSDSGAKPAAVAVADDSDEDMEEVA